MNKEFFYQRIDEIFNDDKTRKVFKEQVDNYLELKNTKIEKPNYKIGDYVRLRKGMFMRGEGSLQEVSIEKLEFIKENGFISPDITIKHNPEQKTPLCIPVWNIQNDMLLKDYIELYSGCTLRVGRKNESSKTFLVPYGHMDNAIEQLRDKTFWMWSAEQTKEIRFMPNLAKDDYRVQIAFIMNVDKANKLIKNDIFNLDFDKSVLEKFVKEFFINDFIYANRDSFTTDRESAIIFGIPSCFIEGILVGRILEKDTKKISALKDIFNECYICNLDGKVIVGNK